MIMTFLEKLNLVLGWMEFSTSGKIWVQLSWRISQFWSIEIILNEKWEKVFEHIVFHYVSLLFLWKLNIVLDFHSSRTLVFPLNFQHCANCRCVSSWIIYLPVLQHILPNSGINPENIWIERTSHWMLARICSVLTVQCSFAHTSFSCVMRLIRNAHLPLGIRRFHSSRSCQMHV